jgi:ribosomal protein S18 acetylase RimI-like enzyme
MSANSIASDFVPLNQSEQTTKGFDCGHESLNNFLKLAAKRHMALGLSRTFVVPYRLTGDQKKGHIAAFYTLVNNSVEVDTLPENKKLSRHPVPIILIAQLGVDNKFKGQGLGSKTLITALRHAHKIATASGGIPSYGVVLDVLNDDAKAFYDSFDIFVELTPSRLFVAMASLSDIA